jgi:hypothetical protein
LENASWLDSENKLQNKDRPISVFLDKCLS